VSLSAIMKHSAIKTERNDVGAQGCTMTVSLDSDILIRDLRASAARMGDCDPRWLRDGVLPEFTYEEFGGHGPRLILLHGLFGAASNWDSVIPYLTRFCRPINLHFPLLALHSSEARVKALAVYTEAFLRVIGETDALLCGNSLGGHVALRLALARPELVRGMVLAASSGLYEHSVEALPLRPNAHFVRKHMAKVFHNQAFVTDAAIDEIASILVAKGNVLKMIQAARSAKKDNLQKLLPTVTMPTLLLWGLNDHITTMDVAHTFKSLIPDSELETIDECGHAPMIEFPEWFAHRVEFFLQRRSFL
jgi:pimeloyl-ACP methyl ester carboxylesterase